MQRCRLGFQAGRTGRTGRRVADAPVVGVDVTSGAVSRALGAADAGVRPMDVLLTRPMRFQALGCSLEPHRTQAIYCVMHDVMRLVGASGARGGSRWEQRTQHRTLPGASAATLTCAVNRFDH
jgi:hypothetical protein